MVVGKANPAFAQRGRLPILRKLRMTELASALIVASYSFRIRRNRFRVSLNGFLGMDMAAFLSVFGASDGGDFKSDALAASSWWSSREQRGDNLPTLAV